MRIDRKIRKSLKYSRNPTYVIEVDVRKKDCFRRKLPLFHESQNVSCILTGVNNETCIVLPYDDAVGSICANGYDLP